MLSPQLFINTLKENNISFFTGVPDSLLKNICAYITDTSESESHIIAANEGAAIGLAAGHHLATGNIPLVYMQNSGIGNTINPLLSLVDKEVYNIPLLMIIGWRGEPNIKDEPQHIKQGKVTISMLDAIGVKNAVLTKDETLLSSQVNDAISCIKTTNEPYALIVQKDTFSEYKPTNNPENEFSLTREDAIKSVVDKLNNNDIVVSTTGMTSRELFEYREAKGQGHANDFLTVGSMGHASQIALGIALQKKDRRVFCFDGDGAVLMHTGALSTIGTINPNNFIHILFNNGAHDSVGGQPTTGLQINIPNIALASGYNKAYTVSNAVEISEIFDILETITPPILIEIKVAKGARKNLGRPTTTPIENKNAFMNFLK